MPAPIFIDFLARGVPEFSRALKTVSDSVARYESGQTRAGVAGARTRTTAVEKEARDKIRAMQKADREHSKALSHGLREAEKAARAEALAVERGARDRVRAMQRADDAVKRIREQSVRETARAEEQKNAESAKWVRKRERESDFARHRIVNTIGGAAASGFRSGLGRVAQATQQVAGTVLSLGGGFSVADSVQRASGLRGEAADLANSGFNANAPNAANRTKRSTNELVGASRAVGIKYGIGAEDAMKGLGEFTKVTGDLDTGMKMLDEMAALARATGSSLADVAAAGANVAAVLPETADKGAKTMAVLRGIAGQGKLGAVEMSDLAKQMGKVVAASGKFEGDNIENIMKMGALAQAARGGGGAWNAATATTAVGSFAAVFGKNARREQFKKRGIDIEGQDGKIRDPIEILADSIDKTGGDSKDMNELFGSVMADRATAKFVGLYKDAEKNQKGTGKAAIYGEVNRLTKGAAMSKGDVSKAASERSGEMDAQFASMREKFDQAVEKQLIPKFLELVPVIEKMIPVFIDLQAKALPAFVELIKTIATFAEANKGLILDIAAHPIGAIMAMEVTKSIAAAGLGEVMKRLLTSAVGGGGSAGAGGVGGGGSRVLGAASLGVAGGAAVAGVITKAGTNYADGQMASDDMLAKVETWKRGDHERGMDPAVAAKTLQAAKGRLDKGSMLGTTGDLISSVWDDSASKRYDQTKSDQGLLSNEKLVALVAALDRNTAATAANSGATGGSPAKTPAQGANMLVANTPAGR